MSNLEMKREEKNQDGNTMVMDCKSMVMACKSRREAKAMKGREPRTEGHGCSDLPRGHENYCRNLFRQVYFEAPRELKKLCLCAHVCVLTLCIRMKVFLTSISFLLNTDMGIVW